MAGTLFPPGRLERISDVCLAIFSSGCALSSVHPSWTAPHCWQCPLLPGASLRHSEEGDPGVPRLHPALVGLCFCPSRKPK